MKSPKMSGGGGVSGLLTLAWAGMFSRMSFYIKTLK